MSDTSLPRAFRDLEKFVPEWTLATEVERGAKRRASSMELISGFYNAVLPRFGEIMSHLHAVPAEGMPAEERRLMDLGLTFVEMSFAVERFGQPDVPDAIEAHRLGTVEGPSLVLPKAAQKQGA
jgi:hypothetical protein